VINGILIVNALLAKAWASLFHSGALVGTITLKQAANEYDGSNARVSLGEIAS